LNDETRELIIIGGGPAGYTAALYAARANLEPLVIEGFAWGGQLMITSDVENYPGYPDGIMGPAMMQDFRRQAERFGAEFLTDDVTKVDFSEHPFRVWIGEQEFTAESVIVATGASARQLGLESERLLQGRGVSYCAVCDAAFFREKEVVAPVHERHLRRELGEERRLLHRGVPSADDHDAPVAEEGRVADGAVRNPAALEQLLAGQP